jgi:hypothetical protein
MESLVLCAAIAVTARSPDSRLLCVEYDGIHVDGLQTVTLARETAAAHECWLPAVPLAGIVKLLCASEAQQHALTDAVFSGRCADAAHCLAVCGHVDESSASSAAALASLPGLVEVAAHTAIVSTTLGGTLIIRIDGLPHRVARTCGIELRRQRWAGALLLAWVHAQVWTLLAGVGFSLDSGSGTEASSASRPGVGIVMATKIVDYGVVGSVTSKSTTRPVREAQLHHKVHVSVFECPTLPSAPDGISIAQKLTDVMTTMRREQVYRSDAADDAAAASFSLQCCGKQGGTVDLALAFAAERNEERCIAAFPQLVTASGGIASTILSARFGKTTFSSADAGWRVAALPSSCSRNSSFFFLLSHSKEMIAHGTELVARCVPLLSRAQHKIHAVACASIAPLCARVSAAGAGSGAGSGAGDDEMDEDAALRDFFARTKTGFSLFEVREALRNKEPKNP